MSAFIHNVTFDAEDPRLLGRFWSLATGYAVVDERDEFVRLRAPDDHGVRQILFLRVERPTPGKNRMHVDLAVRQPQDEIERLLRLGASLADEPVDGEALWREGNGIKWVVLRDPEGNEFCVGSIPDALQEQVSPGT
jgi:Glyoxalase-like domain